MSNYYKAFWIFFLIEIGFTPMLVIFFYITNIDLVVLFKIPLLLSFATVFFFHFKRKIKWKPISLAFAIFGSFSFVYGMISNFETLDTKIISSFYTFFMPIFSISFGVYFAKNYDLKMHSFVNKVMQIAFYLLAFVLTLYAYLHFVTHQINYFGFSTRMDLVLAYMLSNQRLMMFFIGFILVLLSGKRSIALNSFLVILIYFSGKLFSTKLKDQIILYSMAATMGVILLYAYQNNHLRRFQSTIEFDITDDRAAFIATSGRWNEVVGIYEYMQANPSAKFIGAGIGAKYKVEDNIYGYKRTYMKHYSHFTIGGYAFMYGIPFAILLYGIFISLIIKCRSHSKNFYYVGFVIMIFSSLFGASLFMDHKIWVLVGITYVLLKDKKKTLPISYLYS